VNGETVQVDDIQLTTQNSAVNCADLFVRFTVAEWSLQSLEQDAAETTCEIVRSVVESVTSSVPGFITVRLRLRDDCLVIEVTDDQPSQPGAAPAGLTGKRSGVEPVPGGGKLVWCELPLPGGLSGTSVPLPRRDRKTSRPSDEPAEQAEVDPQIIRRILSGLGGPQE
jgi:hypothetical protein